LKFFLLVLQGFTKMDHAILNWPVFFVNYDFSEVGNFFRNLISDDESFMFWHSIGEFFTQNFNPIRRNRNLQKWPINVNKNKKLMSILIRGCIFYTFLETLLSKNFLFSLVHPKNLIKQIYLFLPS
jgi:hypothetical protein